MALEVDFERRVSAESVSICASSLLPHAPGCRVAAYCINLHNKRHVSQAQLCPQPLTYDKLLFLHAQRCHGRLRENEREGMGPKPQEQT